MQYHQTFLRCSHRAAFFTFLLIGSLFCLAGCAQLYKLVGLTEEQTQDQLSQDQKIIIRTVTQVRTTLADIITTSLAGAGAIASGLLARLLGTERQITKAIIKGVELREDHTVKEAIATAAGKAGIEKQLNARVRSLT